MDRELGFGVEWIGDKPIMTDAAHEIFADAVLSYIEQKQQGSPLLEKVKQFIKDVLGAIGWNLSPKVMSIFDKIFGESIEIKPEPNQTGGHGTRRTSIQTEKLQSSMEEAQSSGVHSGAPDNERGSGKAGSATDGDDSGSTVLTDPVASADAVGDSRRSGDSEAAPRPNEAGTVDGERPLAEDADTALKERVETLGAATLFVL